MLNLDCCSRGLGGASCGPGPLNQYRIYAVPMTYSYTLVPYQKGDDLMELSKRWRGKVQA